MVTKNKILIWIIVLLVVLNLSTIASILFHNYQERKRTENSIVIEGQNINGRFIRDHVGFNNEQLDAFRDANHGFRPFARQIIFKIDSLKREMFTELKKQVSDTTKLAGISGEIGDLHGELKLRTFRYYLRLKAISTPEQLPKLEKMFVPLFSNERINSGPGWQGGRGRGRGWRFKEQQNQIDNNLK